MSNASMEAFRAAVADETLPVAERKLAAERYIAKVQEAIPEPMQDDPDVVKLTTLPTPNGDELMDPLLLVAWRHMNHLRGWRESGGTQAQVREHVLSQRRDSLLRMVAEDTTRHDLIRAEAAAQRSAMPWEYPNLPRPVQRVR